MAYRNFDPHFDDDLTLLSDTLEEILASSGDPADQKYIELKMRAEQALDDVRARVSRASDNYYYRAKQAVYRADDYVHEKPWQGIGIGAAAGLVIGLLLRRSSQNRTLPRRGYCPLLTPPFIMCGFCRGSFACIHSLQRWIICGSY